MPQNFNLIMYATAGAFVLYCKLRSESRPMIEFLPHIFPSWKSASKDFFEVIVFSTIGGVIAFGLIQPSTVPQAISAGLGWTGLVSAYSKGKGGDDDGK